VGAILKWATSLLFLFLALGATKDAYAKDDLPILHMKTNYTVAETGELQGQSLTSLALPKDALEAQATYDWLKVELEQFPESHSSYRVITYSYEGEEVDPELLASIPPTVKVFNQKVKPGFFKSFKDGLRQKIKNLSLRLALHKELFKFWGQDKIDHFLQNDIVYRSTFSLVRGVGGWTVFTMGLQAGGVPAELANWISLYPAAFSMTLQFKSPLWTDFIGKLNPAKKAGVAAFMNYMYLIPPAALLTYFGFPPVDGGFLEISKDINQTVLQAIVAQAPWDFSVADGKKYEIENGPSEKKLFYEFKANIKLLSISLASIVGAAMKLSSDPSVQSVGDVLLGTLAVTGIFNYVRVNWQNNENWRHPIKALMERFRPEKKTRSKLCKSLLKDAA